ncbi:MAG TPA: DsbA family protein [Stellaceae bacterium]|nr:DsbA family protein [Stellaceae bacterium]
MREIWLGFVIILALAGIVPASAETPAAPSAALAVSPNDRILGKPDAPITIIEYASLTCPHCRHFETEVLPTLKKKWIDTGKARLILRDYPLDAPALRAAMVARCAPPDRFYPFIETLFDNQEQWAGASDPDAELQKLALLGGMTKKQFTDCLADKTMENEVIGSRLAATQQLGVDATPTFFINGTKFDGDPTIEAFNELLARLSPKS